MMQLSDCCFLSRSGTGSNDPVNAPVPLQVVHLDGYYADTTEATTAATGSATLMQPMQEQGCIQISGLRKKTAIFKKLTPRKGVAATPTREGASKVAVDPSSPAANTRGRKKLHLG